MAASFIAGDKATGRQVKPDAVRGPPAADGETEEVTGHEGVHSEKQEAGSPEESCEVRAGDPNGEQAGGKHEDRQPPDCERKHRP